MRSDLLIRGAELLEADATNPNGIQFDLGIWVKPSQAQDEYTNYTFAKVPKEIPVNCDTTACAMGLFCLTGVFKSEGLDYSFHQQSGGFILIPNFTNKNGDKSETFEAAADLFAISYHDAEYLFDPDHYPNNNLTGAQAELYVADRIREFVMGNIDEEHHPDYEHQRDDD